jgi:hypothetical protein
MAILRTWGSDRELYGSWGSRDVGPMTVYSEVIRILGEWES